MTAQRAEDARLLVEACRRLVRRLARSWWRSAARARTSGGQRERVRALRAQRACRLLVFWAMGPGPVKVARPAYFVEQDDRTYPRPES